MYDVTVIGAGIVGLATATAIAHRRPGAAIAVIDKEAEVGVHQTGHNSGVLHSGLYYRPGSLKARLCVAGQRRLAGFCEEEGLPFNRSGKIVVATRPDEVPAMEELLRRGTENGLVGLRRLTAGEIADIEPHATGVAAIHVPEAGVVDFSAVAQRLADRLPGELLLSREVERLDADGSGITVATSHGGVRTRRLVNCAGLHSDRIAAMAGVTSDVRIVPFRGQYYTLSPEVTQLVRALIYPVPDPRFPFLGVHFTRRIDDSVEVGPNAVLALGREHYRGARPAWRDIWETLTYRGFLRLAARYWRTGVSEAWRSAWRYAYARSAQALVPEIRRDHLLPGGAGVRAQAVDRHGRLLDDFVIEHSDHAVHVLNAPSPAATASLAIGEEIAGLVDV
jgi:L-2-hydroxyglutarate oxidase LhgO